MLKNKITYITLAAVVAGILLSIKFCGTSPEKEKGTTARDYIDRPFTNIDIPRTYFKVNANKGADLKYGTTKITVPECAFLDSSGKVVKGKVELSYREVNDPLSIIISGVPMAVADGSDDYLQSVGMLEVLAWKDGEPLSVNPNCRIKVSKQSPIGDADYNLYNLDTVNRKWDMKQENLDANTLATPEEEAEKPTFKEPDYEALALKDGITKPVKPVEKAKEKFQFNFKMDFSQNPELNIYNGVQWEFAGTKDKEDPAKNPWVLSAIWNEMEIVKKKKDGTYILRLLSNDTEFKTTVKPVFAEEDMEYAEYVYNQKYKAYRQHVDKKKEEARLWRLEQERFTKREERASLFTREIEVMGFGWINIDKMNELVPQKILATFILDNGKKAKIHRAFLLIDSVNSVRTYYGPKFNDFTFSKGRKNQLVVLDELARAYAIGPEAFAGIGSNAKRHTFRIAGEGMEISSIEDLRQLIGQM
jgi:hypothetical protein